MTYSTNAWVGANDSIHFTTKPFKFTSNRFHIDWRRLQTVDVDLLLKENDTRLLEAVVDLVAYGDIEAEDPLYLTELNFVKIFKLSQLVIDYLLWVQVGQYYLSPLMMVENSENTLVVQISRRQLFGGTGVVLVATSSTFFFSSISISLVFSPSPTGHAPRSE